MKKMISDFLKFFTLSFVLISCNSSSDNSASAIKETESNVMMNCGDYNYKDKDKEQVIGDSGDLKRIDSVTSLSIQSYSFEWKLGDYPFLQSLEIINCQSPMSLAFLKNSRCISSINLQRCNDIASMNIPFKEFTNLTSLKIYDCGNIPNEIFESTKLEKLELENISEANLAALNFDGLQSLINLKKLNIKLIGEPTAINLNWKTIGSLSKLENLTFHKVKLDYVGNEIGNCNKLSSVHFSYNDIKYMEPGFCRLRNLKELAIENNPLEKLPECFGELSELESLYLGSDSIKELPDSFANLGKLEYLNMNNSKLIAFPNQVMKLKNIEEFIIISDKYKVSDSLYSALHSEFDSKGIKYEVDKLKHYHEEE